MCSSDGCVVVMRNVHTTVIELVGLAHCDSVSKWPKVGDGSDRSRWNWHCMPHWENRSQGLEAGDEEG